MTDRIRKLTVYLEEDYRDDDCDDIVKAIEMVKGVYQVDTEVVTLAAQSARQAVTLAWRSKLIDVILALFDGKDVVIKDK